MSIANLASHEQVIRSTKKTVVLERDIPTKIDQEKHPLRNRIGALTLPRDISVMKRVTL